MSFNRPKLSAETERTIFVEAGHRCACCGTPFPLERAHIVPWRKSKDHSVENLICLCANCHELADKDWDYATFRMYKSNPWVNRQGRGSHAVKALPLHDADRISETNTEYDWYNCVGFRDPSALAPGAVVLYEEHALFPELDEPYYQRNRRIKIPEAPFAISPRGFVKIASASREWIDPRNRRRRIHEARIHAVNSLTEVEFESRIPVGIDCIVDLLAGSVAVAPPTVEATAQVEHLDPITSALRQLRTATQFVWPELIKLPSERDVFAAELMERTYDAVKSALDTLVAAGHLRYSVEHAYNSITDRSGVLRIHVTHVTTQVRNLARQLETTSPPRQSKGQSTAYSESIQEADF